MRGPTSGPVAVAVRWFDELDSTNAEARRLAEAGETGPLWIAARRQTAGRGRRGRVWESGEGNLAATLLMTTDRPPAQAAQLSFVTALAVGDMVGAWVPDEKIGFKWPNDVQLDGAKLGGILIESGQAAEGRLWLAIGIGINLAAPPEGLDQPVTAIRQHLRAGLEPSQPEEALAVLSRSLSSRIQAWDVDGFEPVRAAWLQSAVGMGRTCSARVGQGVLAGIAEGLDVDGALLLRLDSGEVRRITAGDVVFGSS